MLSAQHNGRTYTMSSFNTATQPDTELASNVYKKVNGWEPVSALAGFSTDEILEIIDNIRIPLARKIFDGERLTTREETYLSMTEYLTDKILNSIAPVPVESHEVKTTMLHAKRLLQRN